MFYRVYRKADRVVVLSRDMQRHLQQRGVLAAKIPNWVDTSKIFPIKRDNPFRSRLGWSDKFLVMYSGNLGLSQRLEQLIEAATLLSSDARFQFAMVGDGANRIPLKRLVDQQGLNNVEFLDYQPKSQLSESLSAANVHIVFLDPRITHCLMPSKIYGVLATACPVLVLADPSCELSEIVTDNELGYVVDGADAVAIADRIRSIAADPEFCRGASQRARQMAVDHYDRARSVEAFATLLNELVGGQTTARMDVDRNLKGTVDLQNAVSQPR